MLMILLVIKDDDLMIVGYFDNYDEEEDDDDDGCVPNTFKRRSPAARGKARGRFAPGLTCPSAPPTHQNISFKILLMFSSIFRISLEAKEKVKT